MVNFDTRIQYLKGVGEARAKALARQGIYCIGDLLRNYPRAYEDWNKTTSLSEAQVNESVCVKAVVAQNPQVVKINGGRDNIGVVMAEPLADEVSVW